MGCVVSIYALDSDSSVRFDISPILFSLRFVFVDYLEAYDSRICMCDMFPTRISGSYWRKRRRSAPFLLDDQTF